MDISYTLMDTWSPLMDTWDTLNNTSPWLAPQVLRHYHLFTECILFKHLKYVSSLLSASRIPEKESESDPLYVLSHLSFPTPDRLPGAAVVWLRKEPLVLLTLPSPKSLPVAIFRRARVQKKKSIFFIITSYWIVFWHKVFSFLGNIWGTRSHISTW